MKYLTAPARCKPIDLNKCILCQKKKCLYSGEVTIAESSDIRTTRAVQLTMQDSNTLLQNFRREMARFDPAIL